MGQDTNDYDDRYKACLLYFDFTGVGLVVCYQLSLCEICIFAEVGRKSKEIGKKTNIYD